MSDKESLSTRQKQILDYIWEYSGRSGRPPTIREIGHAVQITSTSVVNYNLVKLAEKGFLARDAEVSRGLRLTEKAAEMYNNMVGAVRSLVRIPLKGNIVASEPVPSGHESFEVYDQEEDCVEIGSTMLPGKSDDLFALRVSGDSMIDAMVNDGDIVIMRRQETARNGDMVAVWLTPRDITTLKYFYSEGDKVRLQPANPTIEPIYVAPDDVRIQGKVMMVLRQTA
jgi:repressor LexA